MFVSCVFRSSILSCSIAKELGCRFRFRDKGRIFVMGSRRDIFLELVKRWELGYRIVMER